MAAHCRVAKAKTELHNLEKFHVVLMKLLELDEN